MEGRPVLLCFGGDLPQPELVLDLVVAVVLAREGGDADRREAVAEVPVARGEELCLAPPEVVPEPGQFGGMRVRRRIALAVCGVLL